MATKEYASHGIKDAPGKPAIAGFLPVSSQLKLGPNCYAIAIEGDCLAPYFSDSERVICDPDNRDIAHGDTIAIWWKDHTRQPLIKRLVFGLPKAKYWTSGGGNAQFMLAVEQLNPPREYLFSCSDLEAVHKIMAKIPPATELVPISSGVHHG